MARKAKKSFTLSLLADRLLQALAQHWGINQSAVLEKVLRDVARHELPAAAYRAIEQEVSHATI